MSRLSSGVESILEGLFGPELVEDLKLFKGKNLCFHDHYSGCVYERQFCGLSIICYLLIMTILLHCTIWYPSTFTLQDSPSASRREDALCSYEVDVLDGVGPV